MRPDARISSVIEVLTALNEAWAEGKRTPADGLLSDYFKQRRYMGSKDRSDISEKVYAILRQGGALQWWVERARREPEPRIVVLLALTMLFKQPLQKIEKLFTGEQYAPAPLSNDERVFVSEHAHQVINASHMPEWARLNCPEWMEPRLRKVFGDSFESEIMALNEEATVDLRMNTLKCKDRNELIFQLDKQGIYTAPTPHSPLGMRLRKRLPIFNSPAFREGLFEMQDEGAQIVSLLVEAKPGQKVIDFCAGAGGKTLAIAATMENKGRIHAWDVHERRLMQISKRLARAGVDNVELHVLADESDQYVKRHKASADWVVLDVPCSGSGTWRRNPDLKWRTSPQDLAELTAIQARILDSAARLVKPGGAMVYATCSLFEEENEDQLARFLKLQGDFKVEPVAEMWHKLSLPVGEGHVLRMSPFSHGTDGFFAAVLRRSDG